VSPAGLPAFISINSESKIGNVRYYAMHRTVFLIVPEYGVIADIAHNAVQDYVSGQNGFFPKNPVWDERL
jgi:hypothetical protein